MAKTCNNCGTENATSNVPYVVHESSMARAERHNKRLWIALIVTIAMIFASNALWLWAWMQYDYTSEEIIVEQDTKDGGNANYIGNDGDIVNGISEGNNTAKNTP